MKKMLISLVLALFMAQFVAMPYVQAAEQKGGQEIPQEYSTQDDGYDSLIQTFLQYDLTTADPLLVVQAAAYLYLYDNNISFDFEQDSSAAMQGINYFLLVYAPNIGFLANQEGAGEDFFQQKTQERKDNYPAEYRSVYAYAQSIQQKYQSGYQQPNPPATTPDPKTPMTGVSCDVLYERWMNEYYTLIAMPNIDYTKIAYVKQMVQAAQSGENCIPAAKLTREQVEQNHQAAVIDVKQVLNFNANSNVRVIPEHVTPAYCEDGTIDIFAQDLNEISPERINAMRANIEDLLNDEKVRNSLIKTSVLEFAMSQFGYAQSLQAAINGDPQTTFHNFIQSAIHIVNNIVNARGVNYAMELFKQQQSVLMEVGKHIGEEMEGIRSGSSQGGFDYTWMSESKQFDKKANTDGTLTFNFPSSSEVNANDVKFTLAAASFEAIQVDSYRSIQTQYVEGVTLEQFVQEAKNTGMFWSVPMDARSLGSKLTQQVIAFAPDYYRYNDKNMPIVFFAEAYGRQKMFLDRNATTVMPEGTFQQPWGEIYTIGEQGAVLKSYYVEQVPKRIRASLSTAGRIMLGVDLHITYDMDAIRDGNSTTFPLAISAQIYVADYLAKFEAARTKGQAKNQLTANLTIQGPNICNFGADFVVEYNEDDLPYIEDTTNISSVTAGLQFNSHTLRLSVDDFVDVVSEINAAADQYDEDGNLIQESDILTIMDIINTYVSAVYSFNNQPLGQFVADPDAMVAIQYNNDTQEALIPMLESYIHLFRFDALMDFFGEYMGGDNASDGGYGYENESDQSKLYVDTQYTDGNTMYIAYKFKDQRGNVSDIYPNEVRLDVYSDQGYASYAFDQVDGYLYYADLVDIINAPGVYEAYIYASYTYGGRYYDYKYSLISQGNSSGYGYESGYESSEKFWLGSYGYDPMTHDIHIQYTYQDSNGNTSYAVTPDYVNIEWYDGVEHQSAPLSDLGAGTYHRNIADIVTNPSIQYAYISASYKGGSLYDVYYIIRNQPGQQNSYYIQQQLSSYPDVGIDEVVYMLYDNNGFVQYIDGSVVLYTVVGANCYDAGASCDYVSENLYPTYLDGIPTYVIDSAAIRDNPNTFHAYMTFDYTDAFSSQHSASIDFKTPNK